MSIQLMSRCFDGDLPVEGAEQVLLLKLCDMANDDGACWPGLALLARSIRRHERQVRNLLRALEKKGLVVVAFGTGPRHTNRYRITLPPKPVDDRSAGSTRNMNRQPIAGGSALPGETQRSHTGNPAQDPGNGLPREAAIASAPESSGTVTEPPHTHQRPPGVGGVTGQDQGDQKRQREAECRTRFERLLDRLAVANGPRALRRWAVLSRENPLADTFDRQCALVTWCVDEARAQGRTVNYATDIAHLVDQWLPDELRGDTDPPAARAG